MKKLSAAKPNDQHLFKLKTLEMLIDFNNRCQDPNVKEPLHMSTALDHRFRFNSTGLYKYILINEKISLGRLLQVLMATPHISIYF